MKVENKNIEILESKSRTATTNSLDQQNGQFSGIHVVIDTTAVSGASSVVPKIQGKDPISGKYYDILTGAAITTISTVVLKVFPGALAATNLIANDILPLNYRVVLTHGTGDATTYSVSASLV